MRLTLWIAAAGMLPGLTSCYSPNDTVVGTAAGSEDGAEPTSSEGGIDTTGGVSEPTTDGATSGAGDSSTAADTTETSASADPRVRVVHAADAEELDVYVMGEADPLAAGLGFGESTGNIELPEGGLVLELRTAGAAPDSTPLFTTAPIDLTLGDTVTFVAAGVSGSSDPELSFRALALTDGFGDPGVGRAAVRVVNLGIDASAMDIDIGDDATQDFAGLQRFSDTGAGGDPVPAGASVQLGVEVDGAWPTAFTLPALSEGQGALLLVAGELARVPREAGSLKTIVVDEEGAALVLNQNPVANFFHAGIDTGPMDVCVGGDVVVAGFEFGEIVAVRMPPADYAIELHPAPSDCSGAALAAETTGMLTSADQYLVIAHGETMPEPPETQALAIDTIREQFDLDAGPNVVMRFFNGFSDAPVQLGEANAEFELEAQSLWFTDVAFSDLTDQITRAPGDYLLAVTNASIPLPDIGFIFVELTLSPSARDFVVMAGNYVALGSQPNDENSRFFVVDTTTQPWSSTEFIQS